VPLCLSQKLILKSNQEVPNEDIVLPQKPYLQDYLKLIVEGKQDFSCALHPQGERTGIVHYFTIEKGKTYQHKIEDFAIEEGLLEPGSYRIKVIWDRRKEEKGYKGYSESAWINIDINQPSGQDLLFIEEIKNKDIAFYKCLIYMGTIPKEVISQYPASIYSGWALYKYKPELPGPFVKNESAEKSILAAINRDSKALKKWWQIDMLNISTEKEKDRAEKIYAF